MHALAPIARSWSKATTSATTTLGAVGQVAYPARRRQACMSTMTRTTTTAASSTSGRPSSPRCRPSWIVSMGLPPSPPSSGLQVTAAASSSRHDLRRGWLFRQLAFTWLDVCRQIILGCALGMHSSSPTFPVPEIPKAGFQSCDARAPHMPVM